MNYIKEIFTGNQDREEIHYRFIKYSKGTFDAAVMDMKKVGDKIKLKGSYEYADVLAHFLAKNSSGKIKISGIVASKKEIKTDIALAKAKKRLGVTTSEVNLEADAKDVSSLLEMNPEAHILLDVESPGGKVKTKKKLPKPGSDLDTEFCSAEIQPSLIGAFMEEICFDCKANDFKEAKISHVYHITDIAIPEEYKKDAAKARLYAKRKGEIKRIVEIDGAKTDTVKEMSV